MQNSPRVFGKSCDVFGADLPGLSQQFHNFFRPSVSTFHGATGRFHPRGNLTANVHPFSHYAKVFYSMITIFKKKVRYLNA